MEWSPGHMEFFVDDKKCLTVDKTADKKSLPDWPFDAPEYLLLNVAIGGAWGGQKGINDAAFPQKMLVDYVRIYQQQ